MTGGDAFTFLQGQFTNDLRAAAPDHAVYGLWLDRKGRVQADSFVWQGLEGEWWLGSYFSAAAVIRERLEAYIVADDVVVEDCTGAWCGVTLMPPPAGDPSAPAGSDGLRWPGRRSTAPVEEWLFPVHTESAIRHLWSEAAVLTAEQMEEQRIAAGIPAIPADIGPGELPNEAGLEMSAISYTKGCYLGQEVMARLKTMGQVRRRLLRVRGRGAVPSLPAALFQGDRKVGELRSALAAESGFIGLALLSLLNLQRDAPLSFAPNADQPAIMELAES